MSWFIIGIALLTALALFGMIGIGVAARGVSNGMEATATGLNRSSAGMVETVKELRAVNENLTERVNNLALIIEQEGIAEKMAEIHPKLSLPEEMSPEEAPPLRDNRSRTS